MEFCTNDVVLKKAKLEDHDAILSITEEEDLFGGLDYLPFALKAWLIEGEDLESSRRNLSFMLGNKTVGFMSLYFQDGGKVCVKFAFRVSKSIRGKGFGTRLTQLVGTYLKENFPALEKIISAIPDADLTEKEVNSEKLGDLLMKKSILIFFFDMENIIGAKVVEDNPLYLIQKEEFANLLQLKNEVGQLLEHNIVHMNWVPVVLGTEADIEFATRKKQVVYLNGSLEDPSSFSILTLPYSVPNGNTRTSIDIFAKEKEDVKAQICQQIHHLAERNKTTTTDGKTILSIFIDPCFVEAAVEAMQVLGLEKYWYVYGSQNRKVQHMYIYQKHV